VLPSMTATQELVVPRSMPMMAPLPLLAVLKRPVAVRLKTLNIGIIIAQIKINFNI
jgi:hypothetical protein